MLHQLKHRIIPGVDETSKIKAQFLNDICHDKIKCDIIDKKHAIQILGTMQGGYNVEILTKFFDGLLKVSKLTFSKPPTFNSFIELKDSFIIVKHRVFALNLSFPSFFVYFPKIK